MLNTILELRTIPVVEVDDNEVGTVITEVEGTRKCDQESDRDHEDRRSVDGCRELLLVALFSELEDGWQAWVVHLCEGQ